MKKSEYDDLKILFPQTYNILSFLDEDIYQFNAYLSSMREAFQQDLANLFVNLEDVINSEKYMRYFKKNEELKAIIQSSFFIIDNLSKNKHPGTIFDEYSKKEYIDSLHENISGSVKTLNLFSNSLKSKSKEHYWISPDSLKLLFDKTTFNIYLGLIYQQASDIEFKKTTLRIILDKLKNQNDSIELYKLFIEDFIDHASTIEEYLHEITNKKKSERTYNDYYKYFDATLDLIEIADRLKELPYINIKEFPEFNTYCYVARRIGDLYLNINQKNYSSAIVNTVCILDTLFSQSFTNDIKKYNKIKSDIRANKKTVKKNISSFDKKNLYKITKESNDKIDKKIRNLSVKGEPSKGEIKKYHNEIIKIVETEIKKYEKLNYTRALIFKYGTFIANIATAENSLEVQNIIESTVLPAGSARIKRESKFNVSLNAYCGLFVGGEVIKDVDKPWTCKYQKINSWGVTAPVGLAISKGALFKKCKNHSSHSIFVSIIDLGALVAFRFTDTLTESVPNIQLKDIISPGIFYSFGIPKSPLSFNIGYQIGPLLREVKMEEGTFGDSYSRFSIALTVDIPIVNFYTKPIY